MPEENIIVTKSFDFAVRVVNLYRFLCKERKEFVLSKQILRSGTSIGANINEGTQGQSKKDFLTKMNIALKEAVETKYWLRLLIRTRFLSEKQGKSILVDCEELVKILHTIVKTTKTAIEN
ncbi:MAG: four helix bundle protein [Planctomycetaceae bacterium]|jgi:four helix bundle protein|nr:four helix bundle protein [Planctomycetaceae bacterium]